MKTRIALLTLLLVLISGCASGGESVIVYGAFDGKPLPELVLVDTSGKELRRIRLPGTVKLSYATRLSHKAVIATFDDRWYLVDTAQGTLQELEFPEDARGKVSPHSLELGIGARRWALFGDYRSLAYLVNLETGHVSDLTAGITEGTQYPSLFLARFAPAEDSFVISTSSGLWLVPTANPGAARRLGVTTVIPAGFLNDGQQFVYSQIMPDAGTRIVIEQVDGSKSEVVATFDDGKSAVMVPGKRQVILLGQDELSIFSLEDRTERLLWKRPGGARAVLVIRIITADGRKALVQTGPSHWLAVDLERGVAQPLDALTGYWIDSSDFGISGRRWLYFIDSPGMGEGRYVVSLDLQTGETHEVLVLGEGFGLWGPLRSSSDGRLALATVMVQDSDVIQLWLLNAQSGEARLLSEGIGSFSPNGQWVAVSTIRRIGDHEEANVTLMSTGGTETRPLGSGIRPIWVQP